MENIQFKIAICSYERPLQLKLKTLSLLDTYDIPHEYIYIFLHNEEQMNKYKQFIDEEGYNIINANQPLGLKNMRMFVSNFFNEEEKILFIDDDIKNIVECYFDYETLQLKMEQGKIPSISKNKDIYGKKLRKLPDLIDFCNNAFNSCIENNFKLFGCSSCKNALFLKTELCYTKKLSLICGGFFGVINNREDMKLELSNKEDYERSMKFFKKYGGSLKYLNIGLDTVIYKNKGGYQSIPESRLENEKIACEYLINKYPEYIKYKSAKTGFPEIVLKCPKHLEPN